MSGLYRIIALSLAILVLSSCTNPFSYKKNDWIQVTETGKENYQAVYVDKNRVECDERGNCMAWIKMIFAQDQQIPYTGNKTGQTTGYLLARRVDSAVKESLYVG